MHTHFKKRKVPQAISVNFAKKWLYILYNICSFIRQILEKGVRNNSHLVLVFFKENSHSHRKFTKGLFLIQFIPNYSSRFFSELLFLVGDIKINKICQRKLKPGNALWTLEITRNLEVEGSPSKENLDVTNECYVYCFALRLSSLTHYYIRN